MCRRIRRERIDFRIASRITFETFVKGYVQSHTQPAPCFCIQAKFDTGSGSWKGENNWWCEVLNKQTVRNHHNQVFPCCFFSPVSRNSFFTSSSSPVVGRLLSAIVRNKIESIVLRYVVTWVYNLIILWFRDSSSQVPRVVSCLFFQLFVCLFS